jgi:hypothetical protein
LHVRNHEEATLSDTLDFMARVGQQLATIDDTGDTVVVATANAGRLVMPTRTPRGPAELVYIARRLLEEARDLYDEIEGFDAQGAADRAEEIVQALDALPNPDADAVDDEEG